MRDDKFKYLDTMWPAARKQLKGRVFWPMPVGTRTLLLTKSFTSYTDVFKLKFMEDWSLRIKPKSRGFLSFP